MDTYEMVTDGVCRILGKRSNIYLITEEPLVLVDTGMPGDAAVVIDTISKLGFAPVT